MKNVLRTILILTFCFIFLLPSILSAGTCILDKGSYNPGETGIFECSCSLLNEEAVPGHIVWFNESGDILQTTPTNSGLCRTNFFGISYTFSEDLTNYTGIVNFTANADGTGIPNNWDDLNDIIEDNFNVSGDNPSDCIIEFEIPSNATFFLGKWAAIALEVKDSMSGNPLIGSSCRFHVESVNDIHILEMPDEQGVSNYKSTTGGEVAIQRQFDIDIFEPGSTYLGKAYCYCLENGTDTCYYGNNGQISNFKKCTASILFKTSDQDYRTMIDTETSIGLLVILTALIGALVFLFKIADRLDFAFMTDSKGNEIPIMKYLVWLISGWLILIIINIGIKTVELMGKFDIGETYTIFYKAVLWIMYFVTAIWLIGFIWAVMEKLGYIGGSDV